MKTFSIPVYSAYEYLRGTEPHLVGMFEDPAGSLVEAVNKAHDVATKAGLERDMAGRYPALVWAAVWP